MTLGGRLRYSDTLGPCPWAARTSYLRVLASRSDGATPAEGNHGTSQPLRWCRQSEPFRFLIWPGSASYCNFRPAAFAQRTGKVRCMPSVGGVEPYAGGNRWTRTIDRRFIKPRLYQLSYAAVCCRPTYQTAAPAGVIPPVCRSSQAVAGPASICNL